MPKKPTPYRNRSPHGWWIGSYVERYEFNDEDRSNLNRRCDAYENTVILKAKNREEAYRKLVALASVEGSECGPANGQKGFWRFEGVTDLLPIYEELEDGAEVLWHHHRNLAVKTVKKLVTPKQELPIFDDSEPAGNAYHALQRTAPCVTASASTAAFPPAMQVPRRTPRSLSLGSFG